MGQKPKASAEEKVRIAKQYINGEISLSEAAREAHVNKVSVAEWVQRYRSEGATGLLPTEKNRVYSPLLKEEAVKAYLAGKGSLYKVSEDYGIRTKTILRMWIKKYNAHGDLGSRKQSGGGSYMMQRRETTQDERIEIATNCIASGRNYGAMALKYNVSYQQARTWTLRFEELGKAGLEDRRGQRKKDQTPRTELEKAQIEIEQLKRENYLLAMERDLLKKLDEIERRDAFHK